VAFQDGCDCKLGSSSVNTQKCLQLIRTQAYWVSGTGIVWAIFIDCQIVYFTIKSFYRLN